MDTIENELLPNALMMGVDYELFWTLNPKTLSPFIRAFELKELYDDRMAWLQGVYVKTAIVSAMNKECKYFEEPISIKNRGKISKSEETPEDRQKLIKERFLAQVTRINSNFGKEDTNE